MSDYKLVVRVLSQQADLLSGDQLICTYSISTAANGIGCEIGSYKTPDGLLRVEQKIGDGAQIGTIFKARANTGEIWQGEDSPEDLVLTRILWLAGVEPHNSNTLQRYIYLHGTNQEHLLGQPVSHGCIRFRNADIIEVFDYLPLGAYVSILELA